MVEPMRILALNWREMNHPQAGGAELNLFEQASRWVQDGHEVTVIVAHPGKKIAIVNEETIDGVHILRMGNRFTVYLYAAIYTWRQGHKYDSILDVANGIPFFTPLASKTPGVLLVHHVHDKQWYSEFPRPVAAIGRFLERRVVPFLYDRRQVIAVSPTTRDALLDLGFAPEQVTIVYNGVSTPASPHAGGTLAGQGSGIVLPGGPGPRVAYLGRIKKYKRIDLLVRAVAALRSEFPTIHLDIAGDGDARPALESLVEDLGMEQNVTLYGFVDEEMKATVLRRATVFATPSMHEGWGLSVIEANAYGCPAVAFDVPGLRVAIRHDRTGLLAADQAGFEAAIGSLLRDPALRRRLSGGALEWSRRFSWDAAAKETLRVLTAAVAGPAPRRPLRLAAVRNEMDRRLVRSARARDQLEARGEW